MKKCMACCGLLFDVGFQAFGFQIFLALTSIGTTIYPRCSTKSISAALFSVVFERGGGEQPYIQSVEFAGVVPVGGKQRGRFFDARHAVHQPAILDVHIFSKEKMLFLRTFSLEKV